MICSLDPLIDLIRSIYSRSRSYQANCFSLAAWRRLHLGCPGLAGFKMAYSSEVLLFSCVASFRRSFRVGDLAPHRVKPRFFSCPPRSERRGSQHHAALTWLVLSVVPRRSRSSGRCWCWTRMGGAFRPRYSRRPPPALPPAAPRLCLPPAAVHALPRRRRKELIMDAWVDTVRRRPVRDGGAAGGVRAQHICEDQGQPGALRP